MLYRYRFLIILLAAIIFVPLSSFADTVDPKSDCPKKKQSQEEDSVGMYELENKGLEDLYSPDVTINESISRGKITPTPTYTAESSNNIDEAEQIAEEDPNSAMSFNFIYYIIDKFKFTDPLN